MNITQAIEWFSRHKLPPASDFEASCTTFRTTKGKLLLHTAWTEGAYKTVYGYFLKEDNTLQCRHFYQSVSEAAWRAGTGFRAGGAWVKGAEGDKSNWFGGGYIFEGMVSSELECAIEEFHKYHGEISDGSWSNELMDRNKGKSEAEIDNLYKFIFRRSTGQSGIITEYVKGRTWERFLPANLFDEVQKQSSVYFAENTVKEKGIGIGHQIKNKNALWELLNESLKTPVGGVRSSYHEALKESYEVTTYILKKNGKELYIEIGQSENKQRIVKFGDDQDSDIVSIESPICWVRSIRSTNNTSSFGNYTKYPLDLCFLVQKPLDYLKQTSEYLAFRNNVNVKIVTSYAKDEQGNQIPIKEELAFNGQQNNPNIIKKLNSEGELEDKYMVLALFNEKYCPLIRKYKEQKKLLSFRKKAPSTQLALPRCKRELQSDYMIRMALAACDHYLDLTDDARAQGSGKHGRNRVIAFQNLLTNLKDQNREGEFCRHVIQLFRDNKVNNARPGWSMFDSIRAKNNSFFTIFCQYVLCVPAALYDGYELDMIKKITPTKPNIIRTLYFEAIKQGLSPDNPMDLQSPISERLLEICKNWNHN